MISNLIGKDSVIIKKAYNAEKCTMSGPTSEDMED